MSHYINFPIMLLQEIKNDQDKQGLMAAIIFGTMNLAERINTPEMESIAKQTLYLFYRRPFFLTNKVKDRLTEFFELGEIDEDEDYHGFNFDTFEPEERWQVVNIFTEQPEFYEECKSIYREHQAFSILGLNPELIGTFRKQFPSIIKKVKEFEKINGPDAWTSVSTDLTITVYNGNISFNIFRLVAAVKSVVAKRNFNLSYKSVLLSRMFGCKKQSILNEFLADNSETDNCYKKLNNRRQWEKLIDTAMKGGYFSYYSTGRQFFVSVVLSREELRERVESHHNEIPLTFQKL